jgi:hypothetical protein
MSFGGLYALLQNNWIGVRIYLAITGPYIVMNVMSMLVTVITQSGVLPVMWAYVALALLYLPAVVWDCGVAAGCTS